MNVVLWFDSRIRVQSTPACIHVYVIWHLPMYDSAIVKVWALNGTQMLNGLRFRFGQWIHPLDEFYVCMEAHGIDEIRYIYKFIYVYRSCAYANVKCVFLSKLTIQMSVAYDCSMLSLSYFLSSILKWRNASFRFFFLFVKIANKSSGHSSYHHLIYQRSFGSTVIEPIEEWE